MIEAILWASRPEPDPIWVEGLERRLLTRRTFRIPRMSRFGFALAGGLAGVAAVLSLAGVGPLVRQTDAVDAHDDCRIVAIAAIERVPVLVPNSTGAPQLIYRDRMVTRRVTRCSPPARPRGAAAPGPVK